MIQRSVSQAYSEKRRELARMIGLGRKAGTKAAMAVEQTVEAAVKLCRKLKIKTPA